jgi:predicted DNA-binding ribbon-helix-helix protein
VISLVVKRSIVVVGHKTSVSLEDAFWNSLKEIAGSCNVTLSQLVATIDSERRHGNLSSAIRLFVLDFYRSQPPTFSGSICEQARHTGLATLSSHQADEPMT